MSPRLALALLLVVLVAAAACAGDDGDDGGADATPTTGTTPTTRAAGTTAATDRPARPADVEVTGPITGGRRGLPYNPMPEGLDEQYGYVEEEFFVAGTAASFAPRGPLGGDGRWNLEEATHAEYRTRILVRRPADGADFDGTVLVEWLNVSAGRDADPDFGFLHPYLLAEGWAYVGVSAQLVGVEGGEGRLEIPGVAAEALAPLKEWDPDRYGELHHPGDAHAYDIFTDVGRLLRAPGEADPLGGLRPEHLLAAGESQSASALATYINGVHPDALVYDGFLVHSRGAGGTRVSPEEGGEPATPLRIRTDLDAPVLQFETETDLIFLGHLGARQEDTDTVMTWEVAGTAHADQTTLGYGQASGRRWTSPGGFDANASCGQVNRGPQAPVLRAAVHALRAWVVDGTRPPASPRIEIEDGEIVRDEHGNARGGVRTPAVDAPTATLTGAGNPVSIFCSIFGQTTPLPPETLASLYPTQADYVAAVQRSADAAVEAGFLLRADARTMIEHASS